MQDNIFAKRISIEQVEEGQELAPKFDANGLIPVITTDYESGEVLMHGYMNAEALQKSIEIAQAVYYSRSRKTLWHKGSSSGFYQNIVEMLIDDDQDCLWLKVKLEGIKASCHVGYRSCFYRSIPTKINLQDGSKPKLQFTENQKTFDPQEVYGDAPNPTQL